MSVVYFVCHAQPNFNNYDDLTRELTMQGLHDSKLVTKFLSNKEIDIILSSPYKRFIDTRKDFDFFFLFLLKKYQIMWLHTLPLKNARKETGFVI